MAPSTASTAPETAREIADHDFLDAFECILTQPLDRRLLLQLYIAKRELRYEELRKAAASPHKQSFSIALDRMLSHLLINRRYVPQGQKYQTFLSPTPRGRLVAKITHHLSVNGSLPDDLSPRVRKLTQRVFSGESREHEDDTAVSTSPPEA